MSNKKQVFTTYKTAVEWFGTNLVLCNNIPEIDQSIWDNFNKDIYDEENNSYKEIFQWYITDLDKSDMEWLSESFDLLFTYSEVLDCYILAVGHYGTSWNYVACEVLSNDMKDRIIKDKLTYKDLAK